MEKPEASSSEPRDEEPEGSQLAHGVVEQAGTELQCAALEEVGDKGSVELTPQNQEIVGRLPCSGDEEESLGALTTTDRGLRWRELRMRKAAGKDGGTRCSEPGVEYYYESNSIASRNTEIRAFLLKNYAAFREHSFFQNQLVIFNETQIILDLSIQEGRNNTFNYQNEILEVYKEESECSMYISINGCKVLDLCGSQFAGIFIDIVYNAYLLDLVDAKASAIQVGGYCEFIRKSEKQKICAPQSGKVISL